MSNNSNKAADKVILLHGLGRTRRSMARLASALRATGFDVEAWDYPSRSLSTGELERHLRQRIHGIHSSSPVHFVGHSLGCLLIRACLSESAGMPFQLGRIVMVAPPNQGAGIVSRLNDRPWAAWSLALFGKPVRDLAPGSPWLGKLGIPDTEIGIIAGTFRFNAINPSAWFNFLLGVPEPHDGTVELASTRLSGMRDFIAINADHTFICDYPSVIRQVVAFLLRGRFDHNQ